VARRRCRTAPPASLLVHSKEKNVVMGDPELTHVLTRFAERPNFTMQMNIRRRTRLTDGFSKKIENHVHAMSLHFMYCNFVGGVRRCDGRGGPCLEVGGRRCLARSEGERVSLSER
jgi:hypothetical protein